MTITQSSAVERVRDQLDEPYPAFFTDAQIRAWLNEGVREVARRSEWKRTSGTVAVTSGTQFYTAPASAIRIYRLEFQPTGSNLKYRLAYRDINQMDNMWGVHQSITSGIPAYYTMVSANPLSIELSPIPAQSGQINVFYYQMPTDLATNTIAAASTVLDVPMGWEDLPCEYAIALGFRKSRHAQEYQMMMQSFNEKLAAMTEMAVRFTDEPVAVMPDGDGWGFGGDMWGY